MKISKLLPLLRASNSGGRHKEKEKRKEKREREKDCFNSLAGRITPPIFRKVQLITTPLSARSLESV
jgi:hypothetical protein